MGFGNVNGCGACSGFLKWFKPPHSKFFKVQCNQHDKAYNLGGIKIDRKIADLILLKNMRIAVNEYFHNRKTFSRIWFLFLCKLYYLGVRIFGASSFNYFKKIK